MAPERRPSPPRPAPPAAAAIPDWVQAILDEDDGPALPLLAPAERRKLNALPSDRQRLISIVNTYGPIRTHEAVGLLDPRASRDRRTSLAASLANLAREGFIAQLDRGLYDVLVSEA